MLVEVKFGHDYAGIVFYGLTQWLPICGAPCPRGSIVGRCYDSRAVRAEFDRGNATDMLDRAAYRFARPGVPNSDSAVLASRDDPRGIRTEMRHENFFGMFHRLRQGLASRRIPNPGRLVRRCGE